MEKPKFNIGDEVFCVSNEPSKTYVTCPDCAGKRQHEITLGCGDKHYVPCENCKNGYEPPSGSVSYYEYNPRIIRSVVIGVNPQHPREDGFEYTIDDPVRPNGRLIFADTKVFDNEDDANDEACRIAKDNEEESRRKALQKTERSKSWGWHVKYHRGEIRRHQAALEAIDYAGVAKK